MRRNLWKLTYTGRYVFRSVYLPFPVGVVPCLCENSLCDAGHVKTGEGRKRPAYSGCRNAVNPGFDGTAERPWMMWLGAVCVPCARSMGATAPSYISAPYGTYEVIAGGDAIPGPAL